MNPSKSIKSFLAATATGLCLASCVSAAPPHGKGPGNGPGMPPEARENIHALFENRASITRKLELTPDGYVSLTETDDPKLAAILKEHIQQMEKRLDSGLAVRRWDPAFAEYVGHYSDIEHKFEATAKGVKMTVKGRTPLAAKVAQNHGKVISAFLANGWDEHDKTHPKVQP